MSTLPYAASMLLAAAAAVAAPHKDDVRMTSAVFHGKAVNAGTVSYHETGGARRLTLSDDFVVPDAPAPHWQVIDSRGNAYLLQRLLVKEDVLNRTIHLPSYVPDVAAVQIWCAWAEVLLGETRFSAVLMPGGGHMHVSSPFTGPKANHGTVSHVRENGRSVLTLSDDFVIPDTPAPHWQLVDSCGNVHLLERLVVKDELFHRSIVVPPYVRDVTHVQIWCAYAETLLGEASFDRAMN